MAEQFQNFFVTKLREACDATATTIYVDTVPAITEGTLVLEYANSTKHEIIHFTGVSGYGLTGCTRGLEGTTAQSHSAGTDVRQNLTAGIIDKIINGVITTENIANSAVTTAKINNGAVTADKIDFTTLEQYYGSKGKFAIGTSDTNVLQYTINKGGKYLIICVCSLDASNQSHSTYINIIKNSQSLGSSYMTYHPGYWGNLSHLNMVEAEAGDVIKMVMRDTVGLPANVNTDARMAIIQLSN